MGWWAAARSAWQRGWAEASLFGGSLLLYVFTLAPDVVGHDAGEFQFVPPLLGIAHFTGYPLYTLVGWLWSQLPLGSLAYRMNLLSALFAAAAVVTTYSLTHRITRQRWPSLLAAGALAVSPLFWLWATMAGVRSLSVLLPLMILLVAAKWSWIRRNPGKRADPQQGASWFWGLAFALGLGLAHHRSALLLIPGLLFLVLATDIRQLWRWRQLGAALAWFLLPLLSYLYLPLRARWGAPFDQFHPDTWEGFWNLVGAQGDVGAHLTIAGEEIGPRALLLVEEVGAQFGWLGLGLAGLGMIYLFRRDWRLGGATAVFVVAVVVLVLLWDVGPERINSAYLLPAHGLVAVYVGLGVSFLMALLRRPLGAHLALALPLVVAMALVLLAVHNARQLDDLAYRPLGAYREDLYRGLRARRLGMTSLPLVEPEAVLVSQWDQATVFWYLQLVEGINPRVTVIYPTAFLPTALAQGRPVYVAAYAPGLMGRPLTMVGSLVRVKDGAEPTLRPMVPLGARFGDALEMEGYTFWDDRGDPLAAWPGGRMVSVSIFWGAREKPEEDYSVSLRLVGEDGRVVSQQDQLHPVLGLYPTSQWRAGEKVADFYEVEATIPPGDYWLEAVVYSRRTGGFVNLPVQGGPSRDGTALRVARLEVS